MKNIMRQLFLTSLLFCSSDAIVWRASAQGGVPVWTNRYNGPVNRRDYANAIAVAQNGNVIVTGESWSGSDFTTADYATIEYSGTGIPLWTNRYNGPANGEDIGQAIAVDSSGNVYVTGYSRSGGGFAAADYSTIKYSSAGMRLWTSRYHGLDDSRAAAIAVDINANVFVTGYSSVSDNTDTAEFATLGYSASGIPLWTNRYNGPGNGGDAAKAIAVDRAGNVFVTGYSSTNNGASVDCTTIKYSGAGLPLWTNRHLGRGEGRAIAVDSHGDVFVSAANATIKYSGAGIPLWTNLVRALALAVDWNNDVIVTGSPSGDYITIKYSGLGSPLWTNRYDGPVNGDDLPSAIAVDTAGDVIVTGYSSSTNLVDILTVAYSRTGVPLWTNRYDGPAHGADTALSIAVDGSGNVLVTGGSVDGGAFDYVTIKYSSSIPAAPRLNFQLLNNELVLSWTNAGFNLQTAPVVTGPFTNIPAATSPCTNTLTAPQQFFRLISN